MINRGFPQKEAIRKAKSLCMMYRYVPWPNVLFTYLIKKNQKEEKEKTVRSLCVAVTYSTPYFCY